METQQTECNTKIYGMHKQCKNYGLNHGGLGDDADEEVQPSAVVGVPARFFVLGVCCTAVAAVC